MSLLDGLKDSMKNPLAENYEDMRFALESDFEFALERATDVKLSPADIAAILNGEDDVDDEEDDLDDAEDDIDKDYVNNLEACDKATEAALTSILDAADTLDADDDVDDVDLDLDPEEEDELLSEEALIAMIEGLSCDECNDEEDVADTGDASIPENSGDMPDDTDDLRHETGDASIPENTDDPTPDGDEDDDVDEIVGECESLLLALEAEDSDFDEFEDDDPAEETNTAHENETDPTSEYRVEETHTDIPDDDENVEVKAITENDDEEEDDEDEETSLESILNALLENPM